MSDVPKFILMGNIISAAPRRSATITMVSPVDGTGSGGGVGIYGGAVMGAIIGAAIGGD